MALGPILNVWLFGPGHLLFSDRHYEASNKETGWEWRIFDVGGCRTSVRHFLNWLNFRVSLYPIT